MKILVAVQDYPLHNGKQSLVYVHVRNVYYKNKGMSIDVLNFSTKKEYEIDGISVIDLSTAKRRVCDNEYDILLCHAPNIRSHYIFLQRFEAKFSRIAFVFHGHEILKSHKVYPKPYSYIKESSFLRLKVKNLYDSFKLLLWRRYFLKIAYKSDFIFVSKWMQNEFFKWTKISPGVIEKKCHITYNCIGQYFENEDYILGGAKRYDFITIRGFIDGSKYCVDIVNQLAKNNPSLRFLLIGRGRFFQYNEKAPNLEWIDAHITHKEIINYLNLSRCALMPTRTDAQGVMMCEMATFGIPLITSNIPVCHEVFDNFSNVRFIDNESQNIRLLDLLTELEIGAPYVKNTTYFASNTVEKECLLLQRLSSYS